MKIREEAQFFCFSKKTPYMDIMLPPLTFFLFFKLKKGNCIINNYPRVEIY